MLPGTLVFPVAGAVGGLVTLSVFAGIASRRDPEKPPAADEPHWFIFKALNFLSIILFVAALTVSFSPRSDANDREVVLTERAGLDRVAAYFVAATSLAYMFAFFGVNFVSEFVKPEAVQSEDAQSAQGVVMRISNSFTDLAEAMREASSKAFSPPATPPPAPPSPEPGSRSPPPTEAEEDDMPLPPSFMPIEELAPATLAVAPMALEVLEGPLSLSPVHDATPTDHAATNFSDPIGLVSPSSSVSSLTDDDRSEPPATACSPTFLPAVGAGAFRTPMRRWSGSVRIVPPRRWRRRASSPAGTHEEGKVDRAVVVAAGAAVKQREGEVEEEDERNNFEVGASASRGNSNVQHVEWAKVDKSKYFGKGAMLLGASQAVLYPLDLVKTRLQMQRQAAAEAVPGLAAQLSQAPGPKAGAMDVLKDLWRAEGVAGIFRGFTPAMIGVMAGQTYMMALESAKATLANRRRVAQAQEEGQGGGGFAGGSKTDAAIAGMVAACVKELISTPANIISLKLQTHGMKELGTTATGTGPSSMAAVAMELIRTDGFFGGLYRGFFLQLSTSLPTHALFWASHRALSDTLTQVYIGLPHSSLAARFPFALTSSASGNAEVPTLAISGVSAFLGASFAIACTTPVDVLKTHIQVEGSKGGGVSNTLQRLLEEGGMGSLWKGFAPRCLKYAPLASVVVVYFDHAKQTSAVSDD